MTATELKLIATKVTRHTCARARARLRIADEKREAAKLTAYADLAVDNPELRWMLLDRAIECLRRAQELMLATENQ